MIVVAGATPSRLLESRIVGLAVVDVGHQDRSGRGFPLSIRADDLRVAIRVANDDLREQSESPAVIVALTLEADVAAIPSIAECHPDCVRARAKERCDIVGVVLQSLVVARPAWSEEVVTHALAIHFDDVEAQARDVEPR